MEEEPDFDEIGDEVDPVGQVKTRQLQKQGRVDLPDHFYEHLGMNVGDSIMVVCEEDGVKIVEATADKLALEKDV